MSDRVLSTGQARDTVTQLQRAVSGDLVSQIKAITNMCQTLSDPNVWDGNLASQFRGDWWPQRRTALMNAQKALEELQQQADQINRNIMSAGGNA